MPKGINGEINTLAKSYQVAGSARDGRGKLKVSAS